MKCQWLLGRTGRPCPANALYNMKYQGVQFARLCSAHTSEAKKLWPNYEYVSVRKRKRVTKA